MKGWLITLLLVLPVVAFAELSDDVSVFVERFCIECHDDLTEKGDRSFEGFLSDPGSATQHGTLEEILEQLNLGEMPPQKKKVEQPSDDERRAMVDEITQYLIHSEAKGKPASTVLRRLTRYEYNYTMRDLLGVDPVAADRTRAFPVDMRSHGFANIGEAQALSDYQMQHYVNSARKYLDLALVFGEEKPETQSWLFKPKDLSDKRNNVGTVVYRVCSSDGAHLDIGHGQPVDRYPTHPSVFARHGVPENGHYRIRVKATAVGRKHRYNSAIYKNDLSVPLQMGIWHVPHFDFLKPGASEGRVMVKVVDLPDNTPEVFEVVAWMPKGSTPYVNWMNGMGSSKGVLERVIKAYHPEAIRLSQTRIDQLRATGELGPDETLEQEHFISDVYEGPRVRVFEISLEGPLHEAWPPAGHRGVIGDDISPSNVDLAPTFQAFASKAFRRPVKPREIQHYLEFVRAKQTAGVPRREAITEGLTAILSSPRFLFIDEGDAEQGAKLDPYQLANRLSYLLWSSMPDGRLMDVADADQLRKPENLTAEINRMINDPKAEAFARHFSESWLQLYKLGSMPPGDRQFPTYYGERLEAAMNVETQLFVAHLLKENRPITDFLDARYSFLNGALAKHYGVPGVVGEDFRMVRFPQDIRRAGLLGHASVLTATANGVETSPVVRGVWVLENLLGTPPPPPPPDVPPIEPDTRGATTIREQLAKHRDVPACADCHAKIDPWGFALEFYDPVGRFREQYPIVRGKNVKRTARIIDGSGTLPNGVVIKNEADLSQVLLSRKKQFARNLTQKLLVYGTGRELTYRDQPEVNRIASACEEEGYGFRDLLERVIQSEVFRRR